MVKTQAKLIFALILATGVHAEAEPVLSQISAPVSDCHVLVLVAHPGGPADFVYPVEIENLDYGKPLQYPAYLALKAKFPTAKLASLRRVENKEAASKSYTEEKVVADAFMTEGENFSYTG